ncbi:hypothetical protein FRC17_008938 [Serendipita sp. 399]|nr:hypothetical protein FRC17_008938 [Serendipita sp. 399]
MELSTKKPSPVDNIETTKDWRSIIQSLVIFIGIFSAVFVTLTVDRKAKSEKDNKGVLVDALTSLMNNLANGTHRPYTRPKFDPTGPSWFDNYLFIASLCFSVAIALAVVATLFPSINLVTFTRSRLANQKPPPQQHALLPS